MCNKIVVDWVLMQCYVIPCELSNISMNYFERIAMLGVIG